MPKLANVCLSERSYCLLCDPGELDLRPLDFCVIASPPGANGDGGSEAVGYIKGFEYFCEHQLKDKNIPAIRRKAEPRDVRAWHFLRRRENEAIALCKERVAKHNLQMKVSTVRFDDRQRKISFNFTADKRVDFRELVKDLASTFKARIELWQIGVRDETRDLGGFGVCGRQLCCSSWLKSFAPVSIRCAKTQDIQFSPTKLSGCCGRLRCCLAYEQQQYIEMGKDAPPIGAMVRTAEYGESRVVDRNLIRRTASIMDSEGKICVIPFSKIKDMKLTKEAEKAAEQIVLEPDETPEEATALLEEEPTESAIGSETARFSAPRMPAIAPDRFRDDLEPSTHRPASIEERQTAEDRADGGDREGRNSNRRRGKRGGRNRRDRENRPGERAATPPSQQGPGSFRVDPQRSNATGDRRDSTQRQRPQRRDRDPRADRNRSGRPPRQDGRPTPPNTNQG